MNRETKKEVILNNDKIAYISACGGIEIHHIYYGINDYVYFVAGAWSGKKSYHKAKIYYSNKDTYFKFNGYKLSFNEAIRI